MITHPITPAPIARIVRSALFAIRRWLIRFEIKDIDYQLGHIASVRANDFEVERNLHKRQVDLVSELRRLEQQP